MELKSHQFINYFPPEQANQLCQLAILEDFSDQKVIFDEGENSDFIYLVLEGQVAFSKHTHTGSYQTVAVAKVNDFFGELGAFDGKPRSARALACGPTLLAKIPGHQLMEILVTVNGSVVLNIFRHLIQHLRYTTDQFVQQMVYKEKMVLVGEMVNTIVHDFKGPFTSIQLASIIMKEKYNTEEVHDWCDLIQAQIMRMLTMADEVLEFSRGNTVLDKKAVHLSELIQRFHRINRIYFDHEKVEFNYQIESVTLQADEMKLMRIFQNLVSNSVEAFRGKGGKIQVTATVLPDWLEIQIFDNGPGIPQEIQDRVFEAFITYGKRGGTGLGTAIVKSMVEAHGGTISFQSQPEIGTTFYIYLPL